MVVRVEGCTGKCRKYAIDPCCPVHGIGSNRYILNLVGLVAVVFVVALVVLTAAEPADSRPTSPLSPLEQLPTGLVICEVFGERDCADALEVAWCESRFKTTARNGQYRGLFQMGSWERRTFGHGRSAKAQAEAAERYFVRTGRDWSPWECRP